MNVLFERHRMYTFEYRSHCFMNRKQGIFIISLGAVLLASSLMFMMWPHIAADRVAGTASVEVANREHATKVAPDPFKGLGLSAKAVAVLDVRTGRFLFTKNAHESLPLASLTKIMTALVASERSPEHARITIDPSYMQEEGDSGLLPFEEWQVNALIDLTLVTSSNDGARALANAGNSPNMAAAVASADMSAAREAAEKDPDATFVAEMNRKAKSLKLETMFFLNPTGLDTSGYLAGGYGSAAHMARLFAHAITEAPDVFEGTRYRRLSVRSESGIAHEAENTNVIADQIPGLIASKTGYTDLAGGNLVIAFDAGLARPMVIVALGSTQEARFTDVLALIQATLESLQILQ